MSEVSTTLIAGSDTTGKLTRQELALVQTPPQTATYQPIPHVDIVNGLEERLNFRHINITSEEYCVTKDGLNFFGVLTLDQGMDGASFALGLRNSHKKQFALSIAVATRIFVCSNLCFSADFNIVLHKHTKNFNLGTAISIGLDQAQREFEPMRQRVESWRGLQITDDQAKLTVFDAFIAGQLDAPKYLASAVWENWQKPAFEEFQPRTAYSLNNAFTSAIGQLDPIPRYKATASLGKFFK